MLREDFNKNWTISGVKTAFAALMGMAGGAQQTVDLPHDAMIYTARSATSPGQSGIGFFTPTDLSYCKRFFVPESDKGKAIFLEFEGVYANAKVFVNNEFAGRCAFGYNDFFVRINDLLNYGAENTVTVTAMNTQQPNSRWYSGTGIYRNVKYLVGTPLRIAQNGLRIKTLEADAEIAAIRIDTEIVNENLTAQTGYVCYAIMDTDGYTVAKGAAKFTARAGQKITVEQRVYLDAPKLWDPDSPNMYTCDAAIVVDDAEIDRDTSPFGVRVLSLNSKRGLCINGKPFKMKGGCIHHDNGVIGVATFECAEERRVRMLKDAGYNAIRSAHNPISKALLAACDKYGVMVMDEYCDIWTVPKSIHDYSHELSEHWEEDIESMVLKDYNHPSVIMYSIGNEIPENGYRITSGFARKMIGKIRGLDDTRYVCCGINPMVAAMDKLGEIAASAGSDAKGSEINEFMSNAANMKEVIPAHPAVEAAIEEACDMLDIVGYNYAKVRYEIDRKKYPNRMILGSETYPADLAENWEEVEANPNLLGDFSWTAWDYLGEAAIGNIRYADTAEQFYGAYPWLIAWCGDFDITGYRRPVSYWREIVWGGRNHEPYIAVQKPERYGQQPMPSSWSFTDAVSSWTWPGFEGKGAVVEVYSDADEVELLINGKSLGKKPVKDDFNKFYCKWDTVYEPGVVSAVAYIDGKEVGRNSLTTARDAHIYAQPECAYLRAGSNDLCYVNIELRDAAGNLNTAAEKTIELEINGPASIQGSGSGNPKTTENYFDLKHETFYGRILAVVRAGQEKGTATLKLSAEGMTPVSVNIEII